MSDTILSLIVLPFLVLGYLVFKSWMRFDFLKPEMPEEKEEQEEFPAVIEIEDDYFPEYLVEDDHVPEYLYKTN